MIWAGKIKQEKSKIQYYYYLGKELIKVSLKTKGNVFG